MMKHILTIIGVLCLTSVASAQLNCANSMSLHPSEAEAGKFSIGSAVCISGQSVSFSQSLDANSAYANLNGQCQSQCSVPPPPPPPTSYSYNIRAQYVSGVASANLVSVKFSSSAFDPVWCGYATTNHELVLDNSVASNAAFFAAYPAVTSPAQWVSVNLTCSSPVVSKSDYNGTAPLTNRTYSGCVISSFAASSAPSPSNVMCY